MHIILTCISKATSHKGHIFRFPWVAFIYRFDCIYICIDTGDLISIRWRLESQALTHLTLPCFCACSKSDPYVIIFLMFNNLRMLESLFKPFFSHNFIYFIYWQAKVYRDIAEKIVNKLSLKSPTFPDGW